MNSILTFAARGLSRRPLQTFLLLVVLTVSLAGTMTIMAVLTGIKAQMHDDLERVGFDVVNVQMVPNMENLLLSPLMNEDIKWMHELAGGKIAPFRVEMANGMNLENQNTSDFLMITTTPEWGGIAPLEQIEGEFLKPGDFDSCVLDEQIADRIFPDESAVGKDIYMSIQGAITVYRVIGVLKDPFAIRKRFDQLDFAGAARSTINRVLEFKGIYVNGEFDEDHEPIHGALIKVPENAVPQKVAKQLQKELNRRQLPNVAWARKQWAAAVMKGADLTTQVASMLWIVVLFVTGVMILTISLVAIRERYRELAIRRTEGALRSQIVWQLLLENVLLSTVAGTVAIGLSRFAGHVLASRYLSWTPTFLPHEMTLTIGLGVVIGALATVIPAYRAASLDPVEVLRQP